MKNNYNTKIYQRQGIEVRDMRDHAELVKDGVVLARSERVEAILKEAKAGKYD